MRVLLVNGSSNKNGCTFTALSEVAAALEAAGLHILERHEDQGWFCFLCCRKSELN